MGLGTGSGAIAVTIALERGDADVRASDISVGALDTARQNAAELDAKVEFAQGSWFDTDRPSEGGYDVIVSNPPYIENGDEHLSQGDLRFEPQNALTDFFRRPQPYSPHYPRSPQIPESQRLAAV